MSFIRSTFLCPSCKLQDFKEVLLMWWCWITQEASGENKMMMTKYRKRNERKEWERRKKRQEQYSAARRKWRKQQEDRRREGGIGSGRVEERADGFTWDRERKGGEEEECEHSQLRLLPCKSLHPVAHLPTANWKQKNTHTSSSSSSLETKNN